jgi:hypothetical protein
MNPMSKQTKIEGIKEVILSKEKSKFFMKIFIKEGNTNRYYKSIPWDKDIDVTCTNQAGANSLIEYLSKLHNAASKNPKITGIEYILPKE